jgi:chromosome segregation ATPase
MPVRFGSYSKILIAVCLILTAGLITADAQTKKKKRRHSAKPAAAKPVITNPTIAAPATTTTAETATTNGDVKIISTADSNNTTTESGEQVQGAKPKVTTPPGETPEKQEMQDTITNLSNQVNRLNDKLTQMQEDDRYQLDMERLTRAEQRSEQLRMQLMDVQSKTADIEAQLEQIDYALKPENIDRATAGYGTTHPEEARDARKRQLESQKSRLQAQLKILQTSQSRLEVSVANADNEVDLLRTKMQQRRDQMDAAPPKTNDARPNPRKPE